jgi:small-conductance mechanosensitive channel
MTTEHTRKRPRGADAILLRTRSILTLVILLLASMALAQEPNGGAVVIDGRTLWTMKAPRAGLTPAQRAEDTRASILNVAEDERRGVDDLRELSLESESILLLGRVYIVSVTDDDARAEGRPRETLFAERRQLTINAVTRYRSDRSLSRLVRSVALSFGAGLAAVFALMLLRWAGRRIVQLLTARLTAASFPGPLASFYAIFERSLHLILRFSVQTGAWLLTLLIAFTAFSYILGLFPATAGLAAMAVSSSLAVVRPLVLSFVSYLPNLAVLSMIGLSTYILMRMSKVMANALDTGAMSIPGFHREWSMPTHGLIKILLVMFALVIAFPYLPGGESPALKGASIFIGVLVSLGSGSAMSNVIAGVILTYMRPFQIGDRVKIADTTGDVIEKSLLVTRIRTIKHVEVIVPNSTVLGGHILNYSACAKERGLILNTTVTIGYDVPWATVQSLLMRAALGTPFILADPSPFIFQTSLNDFHISYELNAYTDQPNRMAELYSELHKHIQEEFNTAGVEIMSPAVMSLRDGNAVATPGLDRPPQQPPLFPIPAASRRGATGE